MSHLLSAVACWVFVATLKLDIERDVAWDAIVVPSPTLCSAYFSAIFSTVLLETKAILKATLKFFAASCRVFLAALQTL